MQVKFDMHTSISLKYFFLVVGSNCEDGWEENGGKCYFFGHEEDKQTWKGAEEECKMRNGSHLSSVTDQQTDDFIARKLRKGESMWIGAKQTFESNKGSWAWADGCSPWSWSWADGYNPDDKLEYECAFLEKSIANSVGWRASKCDDTRRQLRYVCSTSICSDGNRLTPAVDPKTIVDNCNCNCKCTATAIAIGLLAIVLLLLIAVAVLTFKLKKNRKRERGENGLYGLYYNADGERFDQRYAYAEDRNDYYDQS